MTAERLKLDDRPPRAGRQPLPPMPFRTPPSDAGESRSSSTPDAAERAGRGVAPRVRRRTAILAATAALGTVIGFLVPLPASGRLVEGLTDALHSPAFLTLTFLTLHWARRCGLCSWRGDAMLGLALFGCGATLEYLQWYSGRSPALHDLAGNLCGIGAGMLLHWCWRDRSHSGHRRSSGRAMATTFLALSLLLVGMQPGLALIFETLFS